MSIYSTYYTFTRLRANKRINCGTLETIRKEVSSKYEFGDLIKYLKIDTTCPDAGHGFGITWASQVRLGLTGKTKLERDRQVDLIQLVSPTFKRFFNI